MSDLYTTLGELVKQAAKGDALAFEELYNQIAPKLYYIAFKTLKNQQDAWEVVQETMLNIYQNLDKIQYPSAFMAYSQRIAVGKSIDMLRKRGKAPVASYEELLEDKFELMDHELLPEDYILNAELQKHILEAVDALPENQRIAILLYYYEQFNVREVSQILEISENSVRLRLSRARAALRRSMRASTKKDQAVRMYGIPLFGFGILTRALRSEAAEVISPEAVQQSWVNLSAMLAASAEAGKVAGSAGLLSAVGVPATIAVCCVGMCVLVIGLPKPGAVTDTTSFVQNTQQHKPSLPEQMEDSAVILPPNLEVNGPPELVPSGSGEPVDLPEPEVFDDIPTAPPEQETIVLPEESTPPPQQRPADIPSPPSESSDDGTLPQPEIIVQHAQLRYPAGQTVTAEQIIADAGAYTKYTNEPLQVLLLEEIDSSIPAEHLVFLYIDQGEQQELQKVITVIFYEESGD